MINNDSSQNLTRIIKQQRTAVGLTLRELSARSGVSSYCGGHLGGIAMQYTTWYQFKKDLERRLGHSLLNRRWLEVKPKAPLPWDDTHLREALSAVASSKGATSG